MAENKGFHWIGRKWREKYKGFSKGGLGWKEWGWEKNDLVKGKMWESIFLRHLYVTQWTKVRRRHLYVTIGKEIRMRHLYETAISVTLMWRIFKISKSINVTFTWRSKSRHLRDVYSKTYLTNPFWIKLYLLICKYIMTAGGTKLSF